MTVRNLYPNADPTIMYDFANSKVLDPRLTFTRSSSATYVDESGVMRTAANNQPRFDHDVTTRESLGLLIEEQRTNSLRNPRCEGAVAGTPGTMPTHWSIVATQGLSTSVVGSGTEDGVGYVDIRFFGTPTTTGVLQVNPDSTVAASDGQTWIYSIFTRLSAGSMTNVGNATLALAGGSANGTTTYTLNSNPLGQTRRSVQVTTAGGSTFVLPRWRINVTIGQAVDFTVRLGGVQLERGAHITTLIQPPVATLAASTRLADVINMTSLTPWFNSTQGSWYLDGASRVTGTQPMISMDDATANEQLNIGTSTTSAKFTVTDLGSTQVDLTGGSITSLTPFKMAAVYGVNDFAVSLNAQTVQTDTSGSVPSLTTLRIGTDQAGNMLSGHVSKMAYYVVRVTNPQLQALTK